MTEELKKTLTNVLLGIPAPLCRLKGCGVPSKPNRNYCSGLHCILDRLRTANKNKRKRKNKIQKSSYDVLVLALACKLYRVKEVDTRFINEDSATELLEFEKFLNSSTNEEKEKLLNARGNHILAEWLVDELIKMGVLE